MTDTELLLALAEIAGVFVGFGALIAVRSGGASEVAEVAYMRAVVSMGMLTVVAALVPVILGRYGLVAHEAWALSSGLLLLGWFVLLVAMWRTPEYRTNMATEFQADRTRARWVVVVESVVYVIYAGTTLLSPIVILLGAAPEFEAAIYLTSVMLILAGAGWSLLSLVYAQRGRQAA